MKRLGKIAAGLAAALAVSAGACAAATTGNPPTNAAPVINAASADNPYAEIIARNIFNLSPPPNPADQAVADAQKNLPKITVTGIMAVFGHSQVLFKVGAKPGKAGKDQYYNLSEGQGQDDIEVVSIDEQNGLVTFKNNGFEQQLPLAESAAAGGPGGSSSPTASPGMRVTGNPGASGASSPGGSGGTTIINFAGHGAPGAGLVSSGGNNNNGGSPTFGSSLPNNGGVNLNGFFGSSNTRTYNPAQELPQYTPQQAATLLEAQRAVYEEQGNPLSKLLPPPLPGQNIPGQGQ